MCPERRGGNDASVRRGLRPRSPSSWREVRTGPPLRLPRAHGPAGTCRGASRLRDCEQPPDLVPAAWQTPRARHKAQAPLSARGAVLKEPAHRRASCRRGLGSAVNLWRVSFFLPRCPTARCRLAGHTRPPSQSLSGRPARDDVRPRGAGGAPPPAGALGARAPVRCGSVLAAGPARPANPAEVGEWPRNASLFPRRRSAAFTAH